MDNLQKELEHILSSVQQINQASEESVQTEIDFKESVESELSILEGLGEFHNQEQMYKLFYKGIQKFHSEYLPKDKEISTVIRNLVATILSKKLKKNITYGTRGGDSRQASVQDYENVISAYSDWADKNPQNLLGLADTLLNKGKELGIIPEEYSIQDFVPTEK